MASSTSSQKQEFKKILRESGGDAYILQNLCNTNPEFNQMIRNLDPNVEAEASDGHIRSILRDLLPRLCQEMVSEPSIASNLPVPMDLVSCLFDKSFEADKSTKPTLVLRGITELVGPPGSGKTQLALTLLAHALVSNYNEKACYIWIDLEGTFSAVRLGEILHHLVISIPSEFSKQPTTEVVKELLSRLRVVTLTNGCLQVLLRFLDKAITSLEAHADTFLVVDSIGAAARRTDYRERNQMFEVIGGMLSKWQQRNGGGLPTIMINQISTFQGMSLDNPTSRYVDPFASRYQLPEPALGMIWATEVQTRLYLSKLHVTNRNSLRSGKSSTLTTLRPLLCSTMSPDDLLLCRIDDGGLLVTSQDQIYE